MNSGVISKAGHVTAELLSGHEVWVLVLVLLRHTCRHQREAQQFRHTCRRHTCRRHTCRHTCHHLPLGTRRHTCHHHTWGRHSRQHLPWGSHLLHTIHHSDGRHGGGDLLHRSGDLRRHTLQIHMWQGNTLQLHEGNLRRSPSQVLPNNFQHMDLEEVACQHIPSSQTGVEARSSHK